MKLWEEHVTITTKHGRMPAFAAAPADGEPVPGIIFYMDAPGFREELCNMARPHRQTGLLLRCAGYVLPSRHLPL